MAKTRVATLALTVLVALTLGASAHGDAAPRTGPDFGQPKIRKPRVLISDFGVTVKVSLATPLDRTAAQGKAAGAGLVLAIEDGDGSRAGVLLHDAKTLRQTRSKGLSSPIVAFTKGREAWFFATDPDIARVALGGFVQSKVGGARASIESAAGLISDTVGYFLPPLTVYITPEQMGFGKVAHSKAEYCNEVKRQLALAEEVLRQVPRNPFPAGDDAGHWARSVASLKKWMARARAYLAAQCAEGAGTGGGPAGGGQGEPAPIDGGGGPANIPPLITQTSVPDDGKAGTAVSVDGKASDADGQVTSWTWNWGDGTSTSGAGPAVKSGHTYSGPGKYNVTLTVFDDKGTGTTSAPEQIAVGAAGSKSSDEGIAGFFILCPNSTENVGELDITVLIPSYAEEPITFTLEPAPKICPNASQEVIVVERLNGNSEGKKDEWGNLRDRYHIKIKLTHTGGTGDQQVEPVATVSWK